MSEKFRTMSLCHLVEVKINDHHPHAYKPHFHKELSVGVIRSGKTILTMNGHDYLLSAGDAVVILPDMIHLCQPVDLNNWAFTMFYLEGEYRDLFVAALKLHCNPKMIKAGIGKLPKATYEWLIALADYYIEQRDTFAFESELTDFLNQLIDDVALIENAHSDQQMAPLRAYLEKHFLDKLSLDTLANKFEINKFRLIRDFKRVYGVTPSAFQLTLKVNYAKSLLKRGESLVDVAYLAGFYDQPHLSREFKKVTGLTLRDYQSQKSRVLL